MDITMQLSSAQLTEEQLFSLTREMAESITQETDIPSRIPEDEAAAGAKGDPITLGTLILTFISSGAAVALFEVLKTYFSRDSSLKISFEKPNGSRVEVSAHNMEPDKMQETITRLQEILER